MSAVFHRRRRYPHVVTGLLGSSLALFLLSWLVIRAGNGAAGASLVAQAEAGLDAILSHLLTLDPKFLIPLLLCEGAVQCAKALKWKAILNTVHPVRYVNALRGVVIGAAATHLVPLRLDEVARAGVVARRERIAVATVFGTVVLDRIIEVLMLGAVLASLNLVMGGLPLVFQHAIQLLGAGFLIAVAGSVALLRWEKRINEMLPKNTIGERLGRVLSGLVEGLRSLPTGRQLALLLLGAGGEWLATFVFYGLILSMAGLDFSAAISMLLAVGNTISYALPNLPGALGFFEFVQGGMLEASAGLEPAAAAALALSAHAVLMLPVTLVGLWLGLMEWQHTKLASPSKAPEC